MPGQRRILHLHFIPPARPMQGLFQNNRRYSILHRSGAEKQNENSPALANSAETAYNKYEFIIRRC